MKSALRRAHASTPRLPWVPSALMDRKLKQVQAETADHHEHLYRYHANPGTFMVHEWLRQGAERSQIEDVHAAREQIALALKINPRAHFGREAYQLRAMDWIRGIPCTFGVATASRSVVDHWFLNTSCVHSGCIKDSSRVEITLNASVVARLASQKMAKNRRGQGSSK